MPSTSGSADEDDDGHYVFDEYEGAQGPMPPPPLGGEYADSKDLQKAINEFTKNYGYAVNIRGSDKNKKGIKDTVYFCCSRGQKVRPSKGTGRRKVGSKRTECPFQAVGKLVDKKWTLARINEEGHNHEGGGESSHSILRRYKRTPEVRNYIRKQAKEGNPPKNILGLLESEFGSGDSEKPHFKASDVWNELDSMRGEKLGNITPIQTLNVLLHNSSEYWVRVVLDPVKTEVEYLFWINKSSIAMLKTNGEVMILDCTYKTNRHTMPLAIMTGVTGLNTSFHSGMCFMKGETALDYERLFGFINELYQHLDIPLPVVWLTDGDAQIATGLKAVIPDASHALCIWHIEQNVATNCKKHFSTNEAWQVFFGSKQGPKEDHITGEFQRLIHASTEDEFDLRWKALQDKYDPIDEDICIYLSNEIIPKKQQWCKAWTDQKMHFNNHTSSRSEGGHAQLKAELKSSTGDLMSVVEKADRRCDRIRRDYINQVENAKKRLNHQLRRPLYRDLMAYITPHALRAIDDHYTRLLEAQKKNTSLPACTGSFRRTMGLPCAHDIERRLADVAGEGVLKLEDVHPHWRYRKPNNRHYTAPNTFVQLSDDEAPPPPDPLLQIQNPRKVKAKGRPAESSNKAKGGRDRVAERQRRSTQRDPSGFEYAETIDLTSEVQVPSSQPPPPSDYTIMPPPPSQLYSRSMTQFSGEFTGSAATSTTTSQAATGRKRKANTTANTNTKRAKKTG